MYHVMNRGDQREAIFQDDRDRQRFLGQGAHGQGRDRPAAAAGDDHAFEVDRGASADGDLDLRLQPPEPKACGFTSSGALPLCQW